MNKPTSKLLSDRLPADLHRRLGNWGEVMRDRLRRSTSPTYQICKDLARRAGQTRNLESEPEREWDENDAQLLEDGWRSSRNRIQPKFRAILRAHYVENAHWRMTCRVLCIRSHEYDDELVRAVIVFQSIVAFWELARHNSSQDNLTTV